MDICNVTDRWCVTERCNVRDRYDVMDKYDVTERCSESTYSFLAQFIGEIYHVV